MSLCSPDEVKSFSSEPFCNVTFFLWGLFLCSIFSLKTLVLAFSLSVLAVLILDLLCRETFTRVYVRISECCLALSFLCHVPGTVKNNRDTTWIVTGRQSTVAGEWGFESWNTMFGRKEANWRSENYWHIFGSGEEELPLISCLCVLWKLSLVSDSNVLTATKYYSENRLDSKGYIPVSLNLLLLQFWPFENKHYRRFQPSRKALFSLSQLS